MPYNEVFFVNYPYYNIANGMSDIKLPVGHAGVMMKDRNGKYKYFEYGVYTDHIYGKAKPDNMQGNWRSIDLNSSDLDSAAQELLKFQGNAAGSEVRITPADSNPRDVIRAIDKHAYDVNRPNYRIAGTGINNCGSNATDVINAGLKPETKLTNKLRSAFKRVVTTPFLGLPELIMGKGVTSNAVLGVAGALMGAPRTAQLLNIVLGENTTNDFESQFSGRSTRVFKRK